MLALVLSVAVRRHDEVERLARAHFGEIVILRSIPDGVPRAHEILALSRDQALLPVVSNYAPSRMINAAGAHVSVHESRPIRVRKLKWMP
jgi:hypothetical protein